MSTFILAPSSSALAPSASSSSTPPTLHLLPFSLDPLPSIPLAHPISHYFRPRPAPSLFPGVAAGTPIATFRGRQVVGHEVCVPRGYIGVVLAAPARGETTRATGLESEGSGKGLGGEKVDTEVGMGTRSSRTKVKGAGQVALAKPRTRRQVVQPKRKIKLDSDDEDEDDDGNVQQSTKAAERDTRAVKRARAETPVNLNVQADGEALEVPTIQVVQPTPTKAVPLSAAASTATVATYTTEDGGKGDLDITVEGSTDALDSTTSLDSGLVSASSLASEAPSEPLIPSPATEDQPPIFDIPTTLPESTTTPPVPVPAIPVSDLVDIDTRVLRPVKEFSTFTLWTPDAAIPGFNGDSDGAGPGKGEDGVKESGDSVVEGTESGAGESGEAVEGAAQGALRAGWWRPGGSGEGGDDFVRALGEWLGIVEVMNEVLYPEDDDE